MLALTITKKLVDDARADVLADPAWQDVAYVQRMSAQAAMDPSLDLVIFFFFILLFSLREKKLNCGFS